MTSFRFQLLVLLFVLVSARLSSADTLTTLDGKTYEGQIRLESADSLTMQQTVGSAVRVKLGDVLTASFRATTSTTRPAANAGGARSSLEPIRGTWASRDVGGVEPNGIKRTATKVTVNAGSVREATDAFPFFHQALKGDGEIIARLAETTSDGLLAGIMLRGGPEPDAPFAYFAVGGVVPGRVSEWITRSNKGQKIESKRLARWPTPIWLKVRRDGDYVYASTSSDGQRWIAATDARLPLPETIMVGVVCTHQEGGGKPPEAGRLLAATFDSIRTNESTSPHGTGLRGAYYADDKWKDLKLTRLDPSPNFDWKEGTPDPLIPQDHFSVKWTGTVVAPLTGRYRFYARADDLVSVTIGGQRIINGGGDGSVNLKAGKPASIKIEYREDGGAANVTVGWEMEKQKPEPIPTRYLFPSTSDSGDENGDGLRAEYFTDTELGELGAVRSDAEINFQQDNSPADPQRTSFSVRWSGTVTAPVSGRYTFFTFSDDGVRLWVNNKLIIDNWNPNPGVEDSGVMVLESGKPVPLRMESFNIGGPWVSRLMWVGPDIEKQVVPSERFGPPGEGVDTRIVTRDGSELTGVSIESMDDTTLRVKTVATGTETVSMPVDRVARLSLRPLTTTMLGKIAPGAVGVLLTTGDFFEGQVERIGDRKVFVNSLVFGPRAFNLRNEIAAIVMQDIRPSAVQYVVKTIGGSVYMANSVAIDGGKLIVDDRAVGKVTVLADAVRQIEYGGDRVRSLVELTPTVAAPNSPLTGAPRTDALAVDAPIIGLPPRLLDNAPRRTIGMASATVATFNLDGQYKGLMSSVGVPSSVLPTAGVVFVALADGKEIFRSPPRTSIDDPLPISLKLTNVKLLVIKTEPTDGGLPLPGVLADPILTRP